MLFSRLSNLDFYLLSLYSFCKGAQVCFANLERFSLTCFVRHFASQNRKTLGLAASFQTSLCQCPTSWWASSLESLSAVGLYFRLSPCFLCLSKLAPHLSVLVGLSGLEPPTSRLSGVRSNRLSYKPISWFERCTYHSALVEMNGFEPMTPCLQSRCSPS